MEDWRQQEWLYQVRDARDNHNPTLIKGFFTLEEAKEYGYSLGHYFSVLPRRILDRKKTKT